MGSRKELHAIFKSIDTVQKAYFQPNDNVSLDYTAIVYKVDDIDTKYANNKLYGKKIAYLVTIISKSPITNIGAYLMENLNAKRVRGLTSDNLNHEIYKLYF